MIKIPQADGTFLEIKRRSKRKTTGRKRGRPKKVVEQASAPKSRKRPYSIILTSKGKQKDCLGTFRTEQEAYSYFGKLLEKNKKINFPVKYINLHGLTEAKYEIYIIKKLTEDEETSSAYFRNEVGEFIEYNTNIEQWQIIDKADWNAEESFWINGYDPVHERKDFSWIIENLILSYEDNYSFKNILVYKNKLIIDCNGETEVVFCKNKQDSFRLYNEIEKICNKKNIKNIMFSGNIQDYSYQTLKSWTDRLCEVTGFSKHKVLRQSLRP